MKNVFTTTQVPILELCRHQLKRISSKTKRTDYSKIFSLPLKLFVWHSSLWNSRMITLNLSQKLNFSFPFYLYCVDNYLIDLNVLQNSYGFYLKPLLYWSLFTGDEKWCSVTLGKQKVRTKEMGVDVVWQDAISLFVESIQYDKVYGSTHVMYCCDSRDWVWILRTIIYREVAAGRGSVVASQRC